MRRAVGLVLVLLACASAETGCPDAEDIAPCVCTNSPTTYLQCQNIEDAELLRTVFVNSARYRYKEVHIEYSSFQYLPHDMFESVPVIELHLKNVTLNQLFDSPPNALDELYLLRIENTRVIRGILWELLQPLKSLKILNIYYNSIRTLGEDFSQYANKNLTQLYFYQTETRSIHSGVFKDFVNLDSVSFDSCKLKSFPRDIFPRPWNGRVLYFNYNDIETLADDQFADMPNLQTLGLIDNNIAVVPESSLGCDIQKLDYLRLEGNPIKCDCRFQWLIRCKPEGLQLTGQCASPKSLHGKDLKDLSTGDFNC